MRKKRSCANCHHKFSEHKRGKVCWHGDSYAACRMACIQYRERPSRAGSLFMDSFRKGRAIRDEWVKKQKI